MIKKRNKGFTLIELLVVIAIISLLSSTVMASLRSARQKSRDVKRITDMKTIQTALELYFNDNNGYPVSGWSSECVTWGGSPADMVIPGLVPTYLGKMPTPPAMNRAGANTDCYVYRSDGKDYALLDINAQADADYLSQPSLIDPKRDSVTSNCLVENSGVFAWKVSSSATSRCW